MQLESIFRVIESQRIIPVVAIGNSQNAGALASTLVDSGLPIAEITLRTPESFAALEAAAKNSDLLLGVGSLQTADQLVRAVDIGARFAVSAGFSADIAARAASLNVPYFPGVATPTEILQALSSGLTILKFFPAESMGGISTLRAMSAPFPNVRFIPTGGITTNNVKEYLSSSTVFAVGGSWMVPQKAIDAGEFHQLSELIREARELCAQ